MLSIAITTWLLLALIPTVAFAVATAVVAGRKQRTPLGWGLLGLLFGPVGLVLALLQPPHPRGLRRCPDCASHVSLSAPVCSACGRDERDVAGDGWQPVPVRSVEAALTVTERGVVAFGVAALVWAVVVLVHAAVGT